MDKKNNTVYFVSCPHFKSVRCLSKENLEIPCFVDIMSCGIYSYIVWDLKIYFHKQTWSQTCKGKEVRSNIFECHKIAFSKQVSFIHINDISNAFFNWHISSGRFFDDVGYFASIALSFVVKCGFPKLPKFVSACELCFCIPKQQQKWLSHSVWNYRTYSFDFSVSTSFANCGYLSPDEFYRGWIMHLISQKYIVLSIELL